MKKIDKVLSYINRRKEQMQSELPPVSNPIRNYFGILHVLREFDVLLDVIAEIKAGKHGRKDNREAV